MLELEVLEVTTTATTSSEIEFDLIFYLLRTLRGGLLLRLICI